MSVFQILKNNVLIIDGEKQYSDTVDNFLLDAGAVSVPGSVVYDDSQECCVVDGEFLTYPNGTYSGYCDRIQDLLDAQAKRTYVPPAEPTPEDQKASLKADYDSAVKELLMKCPVTDTMRLAPPLILQVVSALYGVADLKAAYLTVMESFLLPETSMPITEKAIAMTGGRPTKLMLRTLIRLPLINLAGTACTRTVSPTRWSASGVGPHNQAVRRQKFTTV